MKNDEPQNRWYCREREREREQCLVETWLGFAAKEGQKEQEKGKFREGSLSKLASKKINQKQKENEYKWGKKGRLYIKIYGLPFKHS